MSKAWQWIIGISAILMLIAIIFGTVWPLFAARVAVGAALRQASRKGGYEIVLKIVAVDAKFINGLLTRS